MERLEKIDEVFHSARCSDLTAVCFLDDKGHVGAEGKKIDKVRLKFSNGKVFELSKGEFEMLKFVHFKLRK